MIRGEYQDTTDIADAHRPPAPLLPVAIGIIAGIVIDNAVAFPTWALFFLVFVGLTVGIMSRVDRVASLKLGARSITLNAGCIAVLFASAGLGALRHAVSDRWISGNHILACINEEPILIKITGSVHTEPVVSEPDPTIPRAYSRGPRTRFLLDAAKIEGREGPIEVSGRVAVSIKEPLLELRRGDCVQMTGWLFRPSGPQNPGAYDWASHYRNKGILAGLSCDHTEAVIVLNRSASAGWRGWLSRLRHRLRNYLTEQAFGEDEQSVGVMSAMVLGQRSAVDRAMNEAFLKTGNTHFLAASGMHVAWLALIGWGVTRILGLHYRISALIVGGLILAFVLLAEPRPSILRAGIIGVLACLAAFFRGRYNSINALACAVVIILMARPSDLFRPAFQFSFMATLGLLHFCPLVSHAIATWLFHRNRLTLARWFIVPGYQMPILGAERQHESIRSNVGHRFASSVCLLFAVSISQWFVTAPLACYHFNYFNPLAWLGTFVLAPFAMLATSIGFLTILLGLLFPSSGLLTGPILAGATHLMVGCVKLLATIPGSLLDGRSPSLLWLIVVYVVFWLWGYRRKWVQKRIERIGWLPHQHLFKIVAIVLVLCWLVPPRWTRVESDTLNVWMLAVGDGTGTVIELPDGQVMIYDFGTRSPFDAGRVGVNFLRERGIRHIDTVFVSHPNFDHYSGIETIAKDFSIGRVVLNDQFESFVEEKSAGWYFLKSMRDRGIPIEISSGRRRFLDNGVVVVESIWPPPAEQRRAPDANDSSTVLRVVYQGRSVLLTGDIAEWGMAGLLAQGELNADVLALPHHGSVVHNTAAFVEAVAPQIAVRSTRQRRIMTTNGIEKLVGPDRIYFSTADDGCVRVQIKKGVISARAVMKQ